MKNYSNPTNNALDLNNDPETQEVKERALKLFNEAKKDFENSLLPKTTTLNKEKSGIANLLDEQKQEMERGKKAASEAVERQILLQKKQELFKEAAKMATNRSEKLNLFSTEVSLGDFSDLIPTTETSQNITPTSPLSQEGNVGLRTPLLPNTQEEKPNNSCVSAFCSAVASKLGLRSRE